MQGASRTTTLIAVPALAVFLFVAFACRREEATTQAKRPLLVSDLQWNVDPILAAHDKRHDPSACPSPRPGKVGCTVLCKPCAFFFCRDGQWVRVDAPTPEELCEPIPPLGAGPSVCPRDETFFCPAECGGCF